MDPCKERVEKDCCCRPLNWRRAKSLQYESIQVNTSQHMSSEHENGSNRLPTDWAEKNNLRLNPSKTRELIVFRRGGHGRRVTRFLLCHSGTPGTVCSGHSPRTYLGRHPAPPSPAISQFPLAVALAR